MKTVKITFAADKASNFELLTAGATMLDKGIDYWQQLADRIGGASWANCQANFPEYPKDAEGKPLSKAGFEAADKATFTLFNRFISKMGMRKLEKAKKAAQTGEQKQDNPAKAKRGTKSGKGKVVNKKTVKEALTALEMFIAGLKDQKQAEEAAEAVRELAAILNIF